MRMLLVRFLSVSRSFTITGKQLPPWKTRQKAVRECSFSNKIIHRKCSVGTKLKGTDYEEIKKQGLHWILKKVKEYFLRGKDFVRHCFLPKPRWLWKTSRIFTKAGPNRAPLRLNHKPGNPPPANGWDGTGSAANTASPPHLFFPPGEPSATAPPSSATGPAAGAPHLPRGSGCRCPPRPASPQPGVSDAAGPPKLSGPVSRPRARGL